MPKSGIVLAGLNASLKEGKVVNYDWHNKWGQVHLTIAF